MFFIIILLNFVLNVEILLDIANHAFTYQCKAAQAAQTACYCSKTLAFPQNWTTSAPQKQIDQDCPDPFPASLQRPCLGTEDHGRNGQLSVALHPVWQVEWQEARQLPNLSTALDQRYKARQHAQITKEPCKSDHPQLSSQQLGMVWRWQPEEQVKEQRRPKRECQKKEGKRQGRPRETGNCTALTLRPTCSDSTLAYARKCSNLKPADSDCTRSSSCEFGVLGSHTQGLPRYQPGPRGHPEDRGEVRQDCNQNTLNRSEQSLQTGGTSCTSSLHNQRSANSPPSELAEAPQRFCGQLAKAAPALQGSAANVWRPVDKGPTRTQSSQETSATAQQASCSSWYSHGRDRRPQSRTLRSGHHGDVRGRGTSSGCSGTREFAAEHCCSISANHRFHGDQHRRGGWRPSQKETQIHGTLWRPSCSRALFAITYIVNIGSEVSCLRNDLRGPLTQEPTEIAEAYQLSREAGAACSPELQLTRCHSIHWDPTFLSEPVALGVACILRSEVLADLTIASSPTCLLSTPKTSLVSSLKSISTPSCNRKVRFQPFAEIIESFFPPRVEPHRDHELIAKGDMNFDNNDSHLDTDSFSFMARAPRRLPPSSSSPDPDDEVHTPTSPSSFDDSVPWRSAQVYDLHANVGRGRIRLVPREARFAEARRLLGYPHHEVSEIFLVQPPPQDLLSINVMPLLLLRHEDLRFGDHRKAVLMDVELHGSTFESPVETNRFTLLVPSPIHRSLLLQIAGVAKYCQAVRNRCLLWHQGQLVRQQCNGLVVLSHGDYVRIAVPPFPAPEVSTYYAVRACQHGLSPLEIAARYNHNPDPDDLFTDLEPEQTDEQVSLQLSTCRQENPELNSWATKPVADETVPHCSDILAQRLRSLGEVQPPQFNSVAPGHFPPRQQQNGQELPWASWFEMLHSAFTEHAATACEEEGPIAFVTTWFLRDSFEQTSEKSRTLRLDQYVEFWQ